MNTTETQVPEGIVTVLRMERMDNDTVRVLSAVDADVTLQGITEITGNELSDLVRFSKLSHRAAVVQGYLSGYTEGQRDGREIGAEMALTSLREAVSHA